MKFSLKQLAKDEQVGVDKHLIEAFRNEMAAEML